MATADVPWAAALTVERRAAKLRRRLMRLSQSLGPGGPEVLRPYHRALTEVQWVLHAAEHAAYDVRLATPKPWPVVDDGEVTAVG